MNTMRESKAFYKKMMMILLVGMMGVGVVGCGSSDIKEEAPKEDNVEKEKQNEQDSIKIGLAEQAKYLPNQTMNSEATKALTAGTLIDAEDLTEMPDKLVLEEAGLAIGYRYNTLYNTEGSNPVPTEMIDGMPWELNEEGHTITTTDGARMEVIFLGISIVPIADYQKDKSTGKWNKMIDSDGLLVPAGEVLSEERIKQLEENVQ